MSIIDLFDRVLRAIGLMRTARAEHIVTELVACRERAIAEDAFHDFGVPAKPDFEVLARRWAVESFRVANAAITKNKPDLVSDIEWLRLLEGEK